jgi:hypothetical protein
MRQHNRVAGQDRLDPGFERHAGNQTPLPNKWTNQMKWTKSREEKLTQSRRKELRIA